MSANICRRRELRVVKRIVVLMVAGLIAGQGNARAAGEMILTDESGGCFHHERVTTMFNHVGNKYVSNNGTEIPDGVMKDFVAAVEASRAVPGLSLESLGITADSVKMHRKEMFDASTRGREAALKEKFDANSPVFDYDEVCKAVKHKLVVNDGSTTQVCFSVSFYDPLVSGQRIEVSSTHECPWMLPWKVQMGDKSWQTYFTALPLKLAALADKHGPCARDLDGREYWRNGFWNDEHFWLLEGGRELGKTTGRKMAAELAGYAEAERVFSVEDCSIGFINSQPNSLFLQLKCREPKVVSTVWWWDHLKDGKPSESWVPMLGRFRQCEHLVEQQPWLVVWKNSADDHIIELQLAGAKCHSKSEREINDFVVPAWRDAGLSGDPEVQVLLRRGRNWCGTVYLSTKETKCLVDNAQPGSGNHWFDKQKISFHPKAPTYMIVQPDGHFEIRTIKADSSLLPERARKK